MKDYLGSLKAWQKASIAMLIVLLFTNPSLKSYSEKYGKGGRKIFNGFVFSVYREYESLSSSHGVHYGYKAHITLGILGNFISLS